MMNSKRKKTAKNVVKNGMAWIVSLVMLVPVLLILVNAFKPAEEAIRMNLTLPKEWTLTNFITVIQKGKLGQSFLNSFLYAGSATVITLCICIWCWE